MCRGFAIESRAEHLTGDGGTVIQREMLERSGIVSWMVDRLEDPRRSEFVTYPLAGLLRTVQVLLGQVLPGQGWRDQDDADALRHDPAFDIDALFPLVLRARSEKNCLTSRGCDWLTDGPSLHFQASAVSDSLPGTGKNQGNTPGQDRLSSAIQPLAPLLSTR